MTTEELRALAPGTEPLSPADVGLDHRARIVAYNDLVSRFRERVVRARNSLVVGQTVEPALEQELRLLAEALPCARRWAESSARRERSGAGG